MTATIEEQLAATVRAVVAAHIARHGSVDAAAVRAGLLRAANDFDGAERPAERRRRENAWALGRMEKLHHAGKGRSAAMITAKELAIDPGDPAEVEIIAQRLRRLWRQHPKKNEQCSFPRKKPEHR